MYLSSATAAGFKNLTNFPVSNAPITTAVSKRTAVVVFAFAKYDYSIPLRLFGNIPLHGYMMCYDTVIIAHGNYFPFYPKLGTVLAIIDSCPVKTDVIT